MILRTGLTTSNRRQLEVGGWDQKRSHPLFFTQTLLRGQATRFRVGAYPTIYIIFLPWGLLCVATHRIEREAEEHTCGLRLLRKAS